ncbi:MAG: carbon storage regulator CsrA [Candidatus Omnitrophica bacterium]|nr:carbon storage regulator CsrA [Candidatus Omnitrophota bacterium]
MLVLTRKLDESIIIGENIEIKVLEVRGEQVRLGIVAPRSISVHRKELYDKIKSINVESVKTKTDKITVPFKSKEGGEQKPDSTQNGEHAE